MMAICLMTMLLTTVGIIGRGIIISQKESAADFYGSYYGMFLSLNENQIHELKRYVAVDEIGILRDEGILKGNEKGTFIYADENARKMLPYDRSYQLKEGKYPEKQNEIAAAQSFFQKQCYEDVQTGDRVKLFYRSGMQETFREEEFVVSGILDEDKRDFTESSDVVFGTRDFYDKQYGERESSSNVCFTMNDSARITMDNRKEVMWELADDCGISRDNLAINDLYLTWILEPGSETIAVCSFLIVGILIFSVIVIHNIFQVGLAQKIQEYGKIKALGATKKQMKSLILKEGMFLAAAAVPVGIVLGYILAKFSFGWLIEQGNMVTAGGIRTEPSLFSMPILLFSACVSLLAVFLALKRPMKIISGISPIEATRYLENSAGKKGGMRKGRKKVSAASLAIAYICGNVKRTVGTILTMGISCVLFVIISSYTGNIDPVYEARRNLNYGQFELRLDYSLADEAYPENNLDAILKENPLNEELVEKLKKIPGVTNVETREIAVVKTGNELHSVSVFREEDFKIKCLEADIGNMDYAEAVKEGAFFYGWARGMEAAGYELDEEVTLTLDNGNGLYDYSGKMAGAFAIIDTSFAIPEEVYRKLNPAGTSYGYVWVDCEEKNADFVEKEIRELTGNLQHLEMNLFKNELRTAQVSCRMMLMGANMFMIIFGLIGFMNLANTMIMNIITKKQEYGILQAVGMTNSQLNRTLQLQGLIFSVGTIILALSAGLPFGYLLFDYAKSQAIFGINNYHIPVMPVLIMILTVGGMQLLLSFVLSRNIKKETLVERIRYQG